MKQTLLQETYPMFTLEVDKCETTLRSTDEVIGFLKEKIDTNRTATYIATFNHYTHTKNPDEGRIDKSILDAKNIIFCFGYTIPSPQVLGLRPRSIGVAEMEDCFVISFMEAPMPVANIAMETWALGIRDNIDEQKQPTQTEEDQPRP